MDELQQFFRDSVVDQLRALEPLVAPAARGETEAINRARTIAHSLKGSGSSYGFPEVTESAARAESAPDNRLGPALVDLCATLGSVTSAAARRLVLVIDDDPLITRLLEARLTTPGRRVTSMTSLQAARQFLGQARPDIILLDLFLPDGDGRSLLREIRHDEATADTPVLVISGTDDPAVVDEVTALGANGFIAKPFLGDDVASRVAAALRTDGADSGRGAVTASYRALLEREVPISVVAIVPETHGPGGTRAVGPDPSVTDEVHSGLLDLVGPDVDIARWDEGEVAIVSAHDTADLITLVDRARLRLRTLRHPTIEGAVVSFSAGIVGDDGRGLSDAYHRAHRFALDASLGGGDRVAVGGAERRSGRVLLAEDDTLTAALIIHRLEREGFEVAHETDGNAALEEAETGAYAIVVLDVDMPGKNGFQVLERLRSMKALDDTPIVMLTAAGSEREVVRGFELGASDYIVKPFSPAELTARLKRFVKL
ncbi:MAG TPA: response regulator [Acidimicrobiia bacterium]|nr:response regulator [Acidimicrobiia bacterium]